MCHFLPVHHLGIAFLGRDEGQNTTVLQIFQSSKMEPHYQMVWCHMQDLFWRGSYPSTEMKSVYSTTPRCKRCLPLIWWFFSFFSSFFLFFWFSFFSWWLKKKKQIKHLYRKFFLTVNSCPYSDESVIMWHFPGIIRKQSLGVIKKIEGNI